MSTTPRVVAFDLDGTLVDSLPDLAAAATAALAELGLSPVPEAAVRGFVGDGIDRLVERTLAASLGEPPEAELRAEAIALYRALYLEQVCVRSRVYPGAAATLDELRARGHGLCCITNKASALARPLLEATALWPRLDALFCADRAEQRKPLPTLLHAACAHFDCTPAQLLMVGDSRHDLGAARNAGAASVAVSHGYDPLLHAHAADWRIDSLPALLALPPFAAHGAAALAGQ